MKLDGPQATISPSMHDWATFISSRARGHAPGDSGAVYQGKMVLYCENAEDLFALPLAVSHTGFLLVEIEDLGLPVPEETRSRLGDMGLFVHAEGRLPEHRSAGNSGGTLLLADHPPPSPGLAPENFSVVAFVLAHNEADVIGTTLKRLSLQGVRPYLLDNWSTDETLEIARASGTLAGWERFPSSSEPLFPQRKAMERIEELQAEIHADWFMINDADEYRTSPWPGVPLRDALYYVESAGFSAVDHTTLIHRPTDNSFRPGLDYVRELPWFEFGRRPGQMLQIKTWQYQTTGVDVANSAGHDCRFPNRRLYPLNFLFRHYPLRSQAQGERKVFRERLPRWPRDEYADGWHTHYDHLQEGQNLLASKDQLAYFDNAQFHLDYVAERLARTGLTVDSRTIV